MPITTTNISTDFSLSRGKMSFFSGEGYYTLLEQGELAFGDLKASATTIFGHSGTDHQSTPSGSPFTIHRESLSLFPVPGSLSPVSYFLFPISYVLCPMSYYLSAVCRLLFPISYSLSPVSCLLGAQRKVIGSVVFSCSCRICLRGFFHFAVSP